MKKTICIITIMFLLGIVSTSIYYFPDGFVSEDTTSEMDSLEEVVDDHEEAAYIPMWNCNFVHDNDASEPWLDKNFDLYGSKIARSSGMIEKVSDGSIELRNDEEGKSRGIHRINSDTVFEDIKEDDLEVGQCVTLTYVYKPSLKLLVVASQ